MVSLGWLPVKQIKSFDSWSTSIYFEYLCPSPLAQKKEENISQAACFKIPVIFILYVLVHAMVISQLMQCIDKADRNLGKKKEKKNQTQKTSF